LISVSSSLNCSVIFQDFLCLSLLELMKVTGQSYYDVQKLLCKVSRACAPKMQTVSKLVLILFLIQYLGKS